MKAAERRALQALLVELGDQLSAFAQRAYALARAGHRDGMDSPLGQFMRERTECAPGARVRSAALYEAYSDYCAQAGHSVDRTYISFGIAVRAMGHVGIKSNGTRCWLDIQLRPHTPDCEHQTAGMVNRDGGALGLSQAELPQTASDQNTNNVLPIRRSGTVHRP